MQTRVIRNLLLTGGVLLLAIALVLVPGQIRLARLKAQKESLDLQLRTKAMLLPFHQELQAVLTASKLDADLPSPTRSKLAQERIANLPAIIGEMTRASGVEMVSASPLVDSLGEEREFLPVHARLRGELGALRRFLVELVRTGYLEHMDSIEIRTVGDTKEFDLRFWLAIL